MAPTIGTVASYSTHEEHSVDFFGKELIVTVTPTASVISQWISNVQYENSGPYYSHPLVVGVGVQWTPNDPHSSPPRVSYYAADLSPGNYYYADPPPPRYYADPPPPRYYADPPPPRYYADPPPPRYYVDPPPDTLQLCVGKECLIIQLSHCDYVPDELRSFLADPQTTYVGVWNSQDAGKLARSRHQLEMGQLLDLRNYVLDSQGCNMSGCSFEEIVLECLGYRGVRLDPEISRSDWSVYNLSDQQILQASLDVYVCSELGVCECLWEV